MSATTGKLSERATGLVRSAFKAPTDVRLRSRLILALTLLVVVTTSFRFASILEPDWQNGRLGGRVSFALGLESLGPYTALVVIAVAVVLVALIKPGVLALWPVKLGLSFAVAMAVTFAVLLTIATSGVNLIFMLVGSVGVVMIWGLAKLIDNRFRSALLAGGIIALYALCALAVGILDSDMSGTFWTALSAPFATVVFVLLASGPVLYAAVGIWLIRHAQSSVPAFSWAAPLIAYVATWRHGALRTIEMYNDLPTEQPTCYIATAAATGHPKVVGSKASALGIPVNRQLQNFKAAELILRWALPSGHGLLRRIYDVVGPPLANRLTRSWMADLAFVALLPLELIARLTILLLPRHARTDVVRKVYS